MARTTYGTWPALALTSSPSSSGRWCSWYCVLVPVTYHRVSTPHRLNVPPSRHWPDGLDLVWFGLFGTVNAWLFRYTSVNGTRNLFCGALVRTEKTRENSSRSSWIAHQSAVEVYVMLTRDRRCCFVLNSSEARLQLFQVGGVDHHSAQQPRHAFLQLL